MLDTVENISFPPKHVLVPIDGSENAESALEVGIELVKKFGSELLIIIVTPRDRMAVGLASEYPANSSLVEEYYEEMDQRSERILSRAVDLAKKQGLTNVSSEAIPEFDSVTKQILERATSKKIDLIVMGTRGLGGFRKLLLGSVSSAVVAHARCNVLVVR
jgi:nucleotide-binding universal stress UspA family protein